jgi:alkylation response protein AidB-like acyl-CoA dehydrogenase
VDDQERFRQEIRTWIEVNCPPSMRTPASGPHDDVWGGRNATYHDPAAKLWLDCMAERGFTAPTWPMEYGGVGLSSAHAAILEEELSRAGCRTALKSLGIAMLGPVLLQVGTEEQKREHLTRMARGAIRWCQGYSEPGAGSDLAGLGMRAVLDGETYILNGHKIWTSHADQSDWMFCLVRTDPNAPKRDGISFILVDMATPGISVRPIRLISGASPFCETFFDNVRVPSKNLVGDPGRGWPIAKAVLTHERSYISRARDTQLAAGESLEKFARRYFDCPEGPLPDPVLRDRISQADMDLLCNRLTLRRSIEAVEAGLDPGPETSMLKLYSTELGKRRYDLMIAIAGFRGLGWEGEGFSEDELALTRTWLRSRASSIEGGTSEIQMNIIAKRVLGLPD